MIRPLQTGLTRHRFCAGRNRVRVPLSSASLKRGTERPGGRLTLAIGAGVGPIISSSFYSLFSCEKGSALRFRRQMALYKFFPTFQTKTGKKRWTMFLKHKASGDLVEVLDPVQLHDPFSPVIRGRFQAGEEVPEPEELKKTDLVFPSGEALPLCWRDSQYRAHAKEAVL
jgi:hypothetical protein